MKDNTPDGPSPVADALLNEVSRPLRDRATQFHASLRPVEVGRVVSIGRGVARVRGLSRVRADELLRFRGNRFGQAFDVSDTEVGVILLDPPRELQAGDEVHRTDRVLDVPVGTGLLGRVIDPLGRPLDGGPPPDTTERAPIERDAPAILDRAAVSRPLQTGVKVVDALIPIGRGQRELILGDRQIGKTAIALDTIVNQRDQDVVCIYCAIGQRNTAVAKVIDALRRHGAMDYTAVVVGADDMPPGLQFVAPYAATSVGEWFMHQGRDVLVIYDDLTTHARAYRELSLLLRRPPGREAYPGDVFYLHSRLLERSTQLNEKLGGGSLTALPIAETEAQNVAAYIPTNLISITDGQIYLSPDLFQKGILPAVDVGRSVSRVGGHAQLPAFRSVTGPLRLAYAQFEELEVFARFSSRLDEHTRRILERGRRIRQVFQQRQFDPRPIVVQIALLVAVTQGVLDALDPSQIPAFEARLRERLQTAPPPVAQRILSGSPLSDDDRRQLLDLARQIVALPGS